MANHPKQTPHAVRTPALPPTLTSEKALVQIAKSSGRSTTAPHVDRTIRCSPTRPFMNSKSPDASLPVSLVGQGQQSGTRFATEMAKPGPSIPDPPRLRPHRNVIHLQATTSGLPPSSELPLTPTSHKRARLTSPENTPGQDVRPTKRAATLPTSQAEASGHPVEESERTRHIPCAACFTHCRRDRNVECVIRSRDDGLGMYSQPRPPPFGRLRLPAAITSFGKELTSQSDRNMPAVH